MHSRTIRTLYYASLALLPLAGVGVIRLLTGIDTGAGLQPAWLTLALATVLVCFDAVRHHGPRAAVAQLGPSVPRIWRWALAACLTALLLSLAGLWLAPAVESVRVAVLRYVRQVVQILVMGFFVFWPALVTRGRGRWRATATWLLLAACGQFVYGLLQAISFYAPNPLYVALERIFTSNPSILSGSEQLYLGNVFRDVPRLRGTVCEPLYLGNFLVMVWPWAVWGAVNRRLRAVALPAIALLLLGTWSRGAWFAVVIQGSAFLLLWLVGRRGAASPRVGSGFRLRPLIWGLAAAFGVVLGLGLWLGFDALAMPWERMQQSFSRQDWSNLTRLYSMQAAWRAFLVSPWVGIGWGQFAWHFPLLVDPMGLQSQFDWPMVNNFPLQIVCETGLAGGLTLAGCAVGLAASVVRRVRRCGLGGPVLPAALSVLGVWAQLLTFSLYNLPHIWIALGLLLAALTQQPGKAEVAP